MKRVSFFLATCLVVLSCGLVTAQPVPGGSVELVGGPAADSIFPGNDYLFQFALINNTSESMQGTTNGFRIYTVDGQGFEVTVDEDKWFSVMANYYDGGVFYDQFSMDGSGADTVGFRGFAIAGSGLNPGDTVQSIDFTVSVDCAQQGSDVLCIDSCFYPPAGEWLWAGASGTGYIPEWGGPYCYDVVLWSPPISFDPPSPTTLEGSHCEAITHTITASSYCSDPPFDWSIHEGVGDVSPDDGTGTATWSYTPSAADVGTTAYVELLVGDGVWSDFYFISVNFTNVGPSFTDGCNEVAQAFMGTTRHIQIEAQDGDCDDVSYSIVGVSPTPVGSYSIGASSGVLTFNTADGTAPAGDGGVTYEFTIRAHDEAGDSVQCVTSVEVAEEYVCGDLNADAAVNISDMTYMVDFLFSEGSEPIPMEAGDVNCDSNVNIQDMTYLVTYLFDDGPIPCANCQ